MKRFKKKDKKAKAYKATLCDSDSSSSEEEDTKSGPNMCFIAKVCEEEVCNKSKSEFQLVSKI